MDTEEQILEAEIAALLRQSKKKRKKHKKKKKKEKPVQPVETREYEYEFLLKRVYALLHRDFPEKRSCAPPARLVLPPLNVCKYKTTRTNWTNFMDVASTLNRPLDHMIAFMEYDMALTLSVNGKKQLIIPSRVTSRGLAAVINRYVKTYVICIRCSHHRTHFRKNKIKRITYLECTNCLAETTVPLIKCAAAAHRAMQKGDRRRLRQAATK